MTWRRTAGLVLASLVGGLLLLAVGAWMLIQTFSPVTRTDEVRKATLLQRTRPAVADVDRIRTPRYARAAGATTYDGCPVDDSGDGLLPYPPTLTRTWALVHSAVLPVEYSGDALVSTRAKRSAADVARQLRGMGWKIVGTDADFGEVDLAKRLGGHRVEIDVWADESRVLATVSTSVPRVCSRALWPG